MKKNLSFIFAMVISTIILSSFAYVSAYAQSKDDILF